MSQPPLLERWEVLKPLFSPLSSVSSFLFTLHTVTVYKLWSELGNEARDHMTELDARVPCTSQTRDKLRALKTDSERYEDVLLRLLPNEDNA